MKRSPAIVVALLLSAVWLSCSAQVAPRVVDIPTRAGVTQRFVYLAPKDAVAAVVLFAGGNGGLQIQPDGKIAALYGNFLVRSRQRFVEQGFAVAVVDAPSDRQAPPWLGSFRQTPEHVADVKAVIAWLRAQANIPVWLIGTSRGTQSVAYVATELPRDSGGPDGMVLASSILQDRNGRPVPMMPLEKIAIPVLVVHHQEDSCSLCPYADVPNLMSKLAATPKKELIAFTGGDSRGDPCEAMAHHGYNGQEADVVAKIAAWIKAH
jgi:dienelactone hydrolase